MIVKTNYFINRKNSSLSFLKIVSLVNSFFIEFFRRFKILIRLFSFFDIYNILNLYYFRNSIQRIYLRLNYFVIININRFL